jgi:hypothetical protein
MVSIHYEARVITRAPRLWGRERALNCPGADLTRPEDGNPPITQLGTVANEACMHEYLLVLHEDTRPTQRRSVKRAQDVGRRNEW